MFRRGPFRRPRMFRPRPLVVLEDRPRQLLREANALMEQGNYRRAAEIYENLGRGAQARGMIQRTPHLFLQAARAHLYSGQVQEGMELLRQGLTLLANEQRWQAVQRNASLAIAELQKLNHPQQASQVKDWLDSIGKEHPEIEPVDTEAAPTKGATEENRPQRLPAKCPFCGASVRPDEVEWINEVTAECPYCGSSVVGEN